MNVNRRCLATVVVLGTVVALAGSVSAAPRAKTVAPGYDLFTTPPNSSHLSVQLADLGVPPAAGLSPGAYVRFGGVPIGRFDFGRKGVHDTGKADTIVRRLDTATAADGHVRIELVGLLLRSTNVPGYYVTLQSARLPGDVPAASLGKPSSGALDIVFGRTGDTGSLRSRLEVNYDVRQGSPAGPIVYSGSTGPDFVAEHLRWQREEPPEHRYCSQAGPSGIIVLTENPPDPGCRGGTWMCHESGMGPDHMHCVFVEDSADISGVNHRLNGRDTSADFHVSPG